MSDKPIKEYIVMHDNMECEKINEKIKEGYQPFGEPVIMPVQSQFAGQAALNVVQIMVKYGSVIA